MAEAQPNWNLTALRGEHEPLLGPFSCGNRPSDAELDEFLRHQALPFQAAGLVRVWLNLDDRGNVAGFFTLYGGSLRNVDPVDLNIAESPKTVPAAVIGHIALRKDLRRQKLGNILMDQAAGLILEMSASAGIVVIKLEAFRTAVPFYIGLGFRLASRERWTTEISTATMYRRLPIEAYRQTQ